MRVLDFTREGSTENYEILYDGLVGTTRGFEAPSETRIVGRILDKLEAIGFPTDRGSIKTFSIKDSGAKVVLEDAEYALMADAIKTVKWTARAARQASVALEFFQSAPEPTPEPKEDDSTK